MAPVTGPSCGLVADAGGAGADGPGVGAPGIADPGMGAPGAGGTGHPGTDPWGPGAGGAGPGWAWADAEPGADHQMVAPGGAIVWLRCGIGPVPARPSGADSGGGAGREPAAILAVAACAAPVAAAEEAAAGVAGGAARRRPQGPRPRSRPVGRGTCRRGSRARRTRNRRTRDRGTRGRRTRNRGTGGRHGLSLPPALLDRDRLPRWGHGLLVEGHLQALGGHPVRVAALLHRRTSSSTCGSPIAASCFQASVLNGGKKSFLANNRFLEL